MRKCCLAARVTAVLRIISDKRCNRNGFSDLSVDPHKQIVYDIAMIASYRNKETEKLHNSHKSRLFPPDVVRRAVMRLDRIAAATCVDDLRFPPSHHLEKLSGNRDGQWSIRINDQWRVCFVFENGKACQVEIVDYH